MAPDAAGTHQLALRIFSIVMSTWIAESLSVTSREEDYCLMTLNTCIDARPVPTAFNEFEQ